MKRLGFLLIISFLSNAGVAQNVGIGINTPHPSAKLDVTDTARGVLIPRMTQLQRNAITNPAEGLMIYQKDVEKGYYYFTGSQWQAVSSDTKSSARLKTQFYISNF